MYKNNLESELWFEVAFWLSAKKVGLRIKELERIYGIEHGNNQRTSKNCKFLKSQEELAADLGISIPTLQNYK